MITRPVTRAAMGAATRSVMGSGGPPPPPLFPPVNTVAPVVSGNAAVGSLLSCTTGTWTNSPTGYTYQWRKNGVNIGGATANTYTSVVGDIGAAIDCVVTASNAGGAGTPVDSNDVTIIPSVIGFVSMTVMQAGSSTPSVPLPSDPQIGDLVEMIVGHGNTDVPVATGWTKILTPGSATAKLTVLRRVMDGSEGANVAVTGVGSANVIAFLRYRGGSGLLDVMGALTAGVTTAGAHSASSITATQTGVLLAAFVLGTGGKTVGTHPAGMVQRVPETGAGTFILTVYELAPSPPGVTGTKTLVWGSTTSFSAAAVQMQIY